MDTTVVFDTVRGDEGIDGDGRLSGADVRPRAIADWGPTN
jgi:hypothetical protein